MTTELVTWASWLLDEHAEIYETLKKQHKDASVDALIQAAATLTVASMVAEALPGPPDE